MPQQASSDPIPERHRIIFYVGHLEAFEWNLFRSQLLSLESFDPNLDRLFAFGIDPIGGGLPSDRPSEWPSLKDVERYRDTPWLIIAPALKEGRVVYAA